MNYKKKPGPGPLPVIFRKKCLSVRVRETMQKHLANAIFKAPEVSIISVGDGCLHLQTPKASITLENDIIMLNGENITIVSESMDMRGEDTSLYFYYER